MAAGTFAGGPIGDRVGRKAVIWVSILGVLPFTLALPYANLFWTAILSRRYRRRHRLGLLGYPGLRAATGARAVGMISGLFFGFAFGIAGIGAAGSGVLADWKGIAFVYHVCAFLPLLGLLTVLLPPDNAIRHR